MDNLAQSPTQKLIAALWQRNQPQILERLAILDRAAAEAAAARLSPILREQAAEVAHKLAGSLGMFGFEQGTRFARELEQHLESPEPDALILATLTVELRKILYPDAPPTSQS
jgi:HPt (histidine-containing phosphotransfer) domain-containing protein